MRKKAKNVLYWPNVSKRIDHSAFVRNDVYQKIKSLKGKKVVSWGNITSYKMNLKLLNEMAKKFKETNFILIGDAGIGEPGFQMPNFENNVHLYPRCSFEELMAIGSELSDVLALWNFSEGSGKYSFPMKLSEYMNCNKPIVLTQSNAFPELKGIIPFSENPEKDLKKALELGSIEYDLTEYSYESRFENLKKLVNTCIKEF